MSESQPWARCRALRPLRDHVRTVRDHIRRFRHVRRSFWQQGRQQRPGQLLTLLGSALVLVEGRASVSSPESEILCDYGGQSRYPTCYGSSRNLPGSGEDRRGIRP